MRLFINGQKRKYVIDDYFATSKESGAWQFSYSKESEIWVQLLEKAWAKANGTYAKTIGGHTGEALHALTGGPSTRHDHKDVGVEELWNLVFSADQKGFVMCTAVASEDYAGEHAQKGLATNHAYTLIGAYETGGHRLVKIRNPWGSFEWNGKWNDNDPDWTDEMKSDVNFSNGNDGEFFLSIEDFKEEFGDTTICACYDDYQFDSSEHRESRDGNMT